MLSERWSIKIDEPYEPGGNTAWVAPATDAESRELVLKVGYRPTSDEESEHEADGLRLWDGDGAARLHEHLVADETSALLLERCVPGTRLKAALPEPEQDVVIAGLMRRLWAHPVDGQPFRPLQSMCDWWANEFEAKLADDPSHLDPGLAREGINLFRELPASAPTNVLLCTDLHADNVLAASREPWLVIDPKPYVGDPTYDPLQHMYNCDERLINDPFGLVRRMAGLLDLDAGRLRLWLFARCVQESFNSPWLRNVAVRLRP